MSRAYRIQVSETLRRVIRGADHVSTHLEILPVLPADEMSGLLTAELQKRGFVPRDGELVREQGGIEVAIDPQAGEVTVRVAGEEDVTVEGEASGWSYEQEGAHAEQARRALAESLTHRLERQAKEKEAELQGELTARLEGQLGDLRQELDQVANQVTAAALKKKAAQLGRIKEISEDPQTGSMTIVLEV